jgi:hypothetical protein
MPPPTAAAITDTIQHALGVITGLIEGGINPYASRRAAHTVQALLRAQDALQEAGRLWTAPPRTRTPQTKGPTL